MRRVEVEVDGDDRFRFPTVSPTADVKLLCYDDNDPERSLAVETDTAVFDAHFETGKREGW